MYQTNLLPATSLMQYEAMRTLELVQPFLPHLDIEIFWGFPLSSVVSWRGL